MKKPKPMKEAYYFSHDSNARNDPKIVALRTKYDYGCFWIIIEMLREAQDFKLPCKPFIYLAVAQQLSTSQKVWTSLEVEELIQACVEEYELLKTDRTYFWSDSLIARMKLKEYSHFLKSNAGKKGAESRWRKTEKSIKNSLSDNDKAMASSGNDYGNMISKDGNKNKEMKEKEIQSNISKTKNLIDGSIFNDFLQSYRSFYESKALKDWQQTESELSFARNIIFQLKTYKNVKTDVDALAKWKKILQDWQHLNSYYQSKFLLAEISKELIKIIDQLNIKENDGTKINKRALDANGVSGRKEFGKF